MWSVVPESCRNFTLYARKGTRWNLVDGGIICALWDHFCTDDFGLLGNGNWQTSNIPNISNNFSQLIIREMRSITKTGLNMNAKDFKFKGKSHVRKKVLNAFPGLRGGSPHSTFGPVHGLADQGIPRLCDMYGLD